MNLEPGSQLGIYEILESLGSGGMGEVYRARDPSLGREVAIKVLSQELSNNPSALERFEREARSIAALSHPNIVSIHQFARFEGHPYVVMELLDGETLRERLGRDQIPWRDQAAMGASVADGLAAAHEKGVIHRDLKPENIFLTKDGLVKILDFDLAITRGPLFQNNQDETAVKTSPGAIMGTAGYMSPEQIRGENITQESDIFSLGCILHEMATGKKTFAKPTTPETLTAILNETPSGLNDTASNVPGEYARTIKRCLEKSREKRFQSARDLAFALRTTATSDKMRIPGFLRPQGNRWRAPAAGTVVIAAALMTTYYVTRPSTTPTTTPLRPAAVRSIAVLPFDNGGSGEATEFLADGITEGLINSLSQIPDLRVVARHTAFTYKGRELDLSKFKVELRVDAILTGKISVLGNQLVVQADLIDLESESQIWGDRYNRPQADLFAIETEIVNQITTKLATTLTSEDKSRLGLHRSSNPEAYEEYLRGRYQWNKRNVESLYQSVDHFREAIRLDPEYAAAWSGLADAWTLLGSEYRAVPPVEGLAKARDAARRALEIDHRLAEPHASLGLIAINQWNWDEAEMHLGKAIELNPNYATAYHWSSVLFRAVGRVEESLVAIEKAQQLDPLSPIIAVNVAVSSAWLGDYERSRREAQRSLTLDSGIPWGWYYLGESNRVLGNLEESRQAFQRLSEIPGFVPFIGTVGLSIVAATDGDEEEALRLIHKVEKEPSAPPTFIAGAYTVLGDYDTALSWLEKAVAARDPMLVHSVMGPPYTAMSDLPRYQSILASMGLDPNNLSIESSHLPEGE